jgi:hypothetical protein
MAVLAVLAQLAWPGPFQGVITGMSALWLGSFLVGARPPILSAASRIT